MRRMGVGTIAVSAAVGVALLLLLTLSYAGFAVFTAARGLETGTLSPGAAAAALRFAAVEVALLAGLTLTLVLLAAVYVPAVVTRALTDLRERVEVMGRGQLAERATLSGPKEVYDLAAAINAMAGDLARRDADRAQVERHGAHHAMVAGLAHEINNPLLIGLGNLELMIHDARTLADDDEMPAGARDALLEVVEMGENAEEGLRRLSRLSTLLGRLTSGDDKPVAVDLEEVIQGCLILVHGRITARFDVQVAVETSHSVHASPRGLSQALLLILLNAAEAMDEQGSIRITARDEGRGVAIRVTDSGPGVPTSITSRLFEPFVTTKPGAAGMGLPTARQLLERAGGSLDLEPGGEGATFVLRLPVAPPNAVGAPRADDGMMFRLT